MGRAGENIKGIRHRTGARIDVLGRSGEEERTILCQSADDLASRQLPCQDAVAQIYARFARDDRGGGGGGHRDRDRDREERDRDRGRDRERDGGDGGGAAGAPAAPSGPAPFRLLVPKGQVGAVLGRHGATIEAMRKETGATIKVFKAEGVRGLSADLGDELVEIAAEPAAACAAAMWAVMHVLRAEQQRVARGPAGAAAVPALGVGAGLGLPGAYPAPPPAHGGVWARSPFLHLSCSSSREPSAQHSLFNTLCPCWLR